MLVEYESQYSEHQIKNARQKYTDRRSDFFEELDQIEDKINSDGELENEQVFRFFHRDAKRKSSSRRNALRNHGEQKRNIFTSPENS